MELSELSRTVLKSNRITDDKINDFVKNLKITLRLEHNLSSKEVSKMNTNQVIEKWYEIHSLPENRICGQ